MVLQVKAVRQILKLNSHSYSAYALRDSGGTSRMFTRSFETKLTEFDKFEGERNLMGGFFESKLLAS